MKIKLTCLFRNNTKYVVEDFTWFSAYTKMKVYAEENELKTVNFITEVINDN